jgi:hypothetical protein
MPRHGAIIGEAEKLATGGFYSIQFCRRDGERGADTNIQIVADPITSLHVVKRARAGSEQAESRVIPGSDAF